MDAQPPTQRSGLEKLLVGCGIGCGALLLIFVIAGSIGTYWFFTPGQQVATASIVGEESVGLIRLNELADDPGVQALLQKTLNTFDEVNRRQQKRALPESMQWMTRFQRTAQARDLHKIIPKEATLILEDSAAGGEPELVLAANFRTMVRPIKAMLSLMTRGEHRDDIQSEYGGYTVYHFSDEALASFVGSTLLIASSEAALYKAIDRIEGDAPSSADRFSDEVPQGDWDAAGVVDDENTALALLSKVLGDEIPKIPGGGSDLDLHFGLDVVSADQVKAQIFLDSEDMGQALAWLAELEERIEAARQRTSEWGLVLDVDTEVQGRRLIVDVQLSGLEEAIAKTIQFD